jgi:hypothetical protein
MQKFIILILFAAFAYGAYYLITTATEGDGKNVGAEGYVKNMQRAEDRARDVMHQENVANAKSAVERFKGEKGNLPASLQECVDGGYLEKVPQGVVYDPSTGTVSATP